MGTIGILHSGSREMAQAAINEITNQLREKCKKPPVIEVPDWKDDPLARAKSLIQKEVTVAIVTGGSRAAHAAIQARGSARSPIIVFTSVAPYILHESDPTITTGVCAHTSDHDGDRLVWLLEMLQYGDPTIGVLWNSNRGDRDHQWRAIVAKGKCDLVSGDINGPLTIRDAFDLFQQKDVDALLVAADPVFYHNLSEVVDRANSAHYPTIYQWREFVTAGGLMSFGANRNECYNRAYQMAADIIEGSPVPTVYEVPVAHFELAVSQSKATGFGRWPLPPKIAQDPRTVVLA